MEDVEFYGDVALTSKSSSLIVQMGYEDYSPYFNRPEGGSFPGALYDDRPTGGIPIGGNLDFSSSPWSPWGLDNLSPLYIANDIENCGVLAAGIDAKARIGTGKGMQPFLRTNITSDGKEELEWVSDSEIQDWLERNEDFEFAFDSSYDKHAYGWNCGSYILDRGQKNIYRVKRHDVYEARLEKKDRLTGRINNLYLSSSWYSAGSTYDTNKQLRISLLEEGNELQDLEDRIANNTNLLEFAFVNRSLRNGQHYYPIPLYRSNRAWVKIARSVPSSKIAMFRNQITIKYLVTIHPKFWEDKLGQVTWAKYTPAEKKNFVDAYYQKIDLWLSGENNGYKSLFGGGYTEPGSGKFIPYVTVETIDDKIKDGKYLPDSGAANSEILFALMINPALMGAGNPGGNAYGDTSGGSNVRESFLVQMMIMEAERRLNASVYNVVKKFNGWSKRLEVERTFVPVTGTATPPSKTVRPQLVFRYPSGLLTTLDTGKSTKPENL